MAGCVGKLLETRGHFNVMESIDSSMLFVYDYHNGKHIKYIFGDGKEVFKDSDFTRYAHTCIYQRLGHKSRASRISLVYVGTMLHGTEKEKRRRREEEVRFKQFIRDKLESTAYVQSMSSLRISSYPNNPHSIDRLFLSLCINTGKERVANGRKRREFLGWYETVLQR